MQSGTKKLSPVLAGVALLGYFFPFVSVSCNRQKVASLTGVQLALGTTAEQPQMFGPPKAQKIDAEPLATLAFLCCLGALGLGFTKGRNGEIGSAVLAGISFVALLLLKSRLEDHAIQRSNGMFQVDYEFGFWLVLAASAAAGVLSAIAPWRPREKNPNSVQRSKSDADTAEGG